MGSEAKKYDINFALRIMLMNAYHLFYYSYKITLAWLLLNKHLLQEVATQATFSLYRVHLPPPTVSSHFSSDMRKSQD